MSLPLIKMRIGKVTQHEVADLRYIRLIPIDGQPAPNFDFIPGQSVSIGFPGMKNGIFAIASGPNDGPYFDLLVRRGQGTSEQLCALPEGSEVDIAGPQGKGFPLDPHRGKNLLLIGVGTGIAPLRSVVRALSKQRQFFGHIMFCYGVLTPRHFCYLDDIKQWPDWKVETILTVTDPDGLPWQSHVGFVQQQIAQLSPSSQDTVAMLVGMPEMIRENTELLRRLGFLPDAILLNY